MKNAAATKIWAKNDKGKWVVAATLSDEQVDLWNWFKSDKTGTMPVLQNWARTQKSLERKGLIQVNADGSIVTLL